MPTRLRPGGTSFVTPAAALVSEGAVTARAASVHRQADQPTSQGAAKGRLSDLVHDGGFLAAPRNEHLDSPSLPPGRGQNPLDGPLALAPQPGVGGGLVPDR